MLASRGGLAARALDEGDGSPMPAIRGGLSSSMLTGGDGSPRLANWGGLDSCRHGSAASDEQQSMLVVVKKALIGNKFALHKGMQPGRQQILGVTCQCSISGSISADS